MGFRFWGRILCEFINAYSHFRMQCQAFANCTGFLMSETVSSSLVPLKTWGYLDSRPKASLGHLTQRETETDRKTERLRLKEREVHILGWGLLHGGPRGL